MSRQTFLAVLLLGTAVSAPSSGHRPDRHDLDAATVVLESVPEVPEELRQSVHRFLETRSASFQDWTEDGEGIYITTRFGSTSQLHKVIRPGGARTQLTFFDEPIGSVERRPGASTLSFLMDEGGDEFRQILLLEPERGQYRRISDGESRNGAVEWSKDGERIVFQSTRRDGKSNDVWLMDPDDPERARLILEAPDGTWWGPSDWSRDGTKLLIVNYVSITDSRVYLLDIVTTELRLITGSPEHPVNVSRTDPTFDASGEGVFLTTDEQGDFTRLVWLDLLTGEKDFITLETAWDVDEFALSKDGNRAAFAVNEGGISRLYLMNPHTRDYRPVEAVPPGVISNLSFNPVANRLAITLSSAGTPSDVFTLELLDDVLQVGTLNRWTYSEVGGLDTDTFVEPEIIRYQTFDEVGEKKRRIPAFLYRPDGAGPFPVVIYVHGGPESQYRPRFSSTFQMWIKELGAAVVAPNVRGSSGYGKEYVKLDNGYRREDSVKDIGALLDWIASRPDLDESRVAVYGGSYGGYMVLASLVHYSDRLRAAVDIVGISNFVTFLKNTQDYRRDLRRAEYGDERDPDMAAFLDAISPNRSADKISTPLFVAQGQNDPRVPVTESEQIVAEVRAAGHEVWYMKAMNEGHGFRKKENSDLYRQIVVMFLKKHLAHRENDS
jgi:dipeptidyl aminopeptidase/acylaminoacyl peptidase